MIAGALHLAGAIFLAGCAVAAFIMAAQFLAVRSAIAQEEDRRSRPVRLAIVLSEAFGILFGYAGFVLLIRLVALIFGAGE